VQYLSLLDIGIDTDKVNVLDWLDLAAWICD